MAVVSPTQAGDLTRGPSGVEHAAPLADADEHRMEPGRRGLRSRGHDHPALVGGMTDRLELSGVATPAASSSMTTDGEQMSASPVLPCP